MVKRIISSVAGWHRLYYWFTLKQESLLGVTIIRGVLEISTFVTSQSLCTMLSANNKTAMASNKSSRTHQALALLLFFLLTLSSAHAKDGIAMYWGQKNGDGTLTSICDTGNFEIVNLASLSTFGCGRTPEWNFAGHCRPWSRCKKLAPEIKHCQRNGVKVFLSLGGADGFYSLCSPEDAKSVSDYLYNNFLSGRKGPFGSVYLDGIDLDIEGGSNLYWDDLARGLDTRRKQDSLGLG
ncbi:hypothetical protein Ahy_A09g041694 [Arachis hypogaea]|uniref:chitinase n=1 Tax=Arachis hypogaea TaxID=3818 RepID=A0A445BDJ4_ARAHY|nr:hypothetical protein Ahy_A09g041694 [Arachis hypogaea]